jgi:hypothetical protein
VDTTRRQPVEGERPLSGGEIESSNFRFWPVLDRFFDHLGAFAEANESSRATLFWSGAGGHPFSVIF